MKSKISITIIFIFLVYFIFSCEPPFEYNDNYEVIPEKIPELPVYDDNGIYVSTTGNDTTGNGTEGNPYKTIQYVLDNIAQSGNTIILRGGTYNEAIEIETPNITIRSKIGEWAIIQTPINDENNYAITVDFDVYSSGSKLQKVEIIGGFYYGIKFETKWDWGNPDDRNGASNIVIEDCIIHDTGRDCIKITPNCNNITIRRCEVYNSGSGYPAGTPIENKNAEGIDNVNGDYMLVQDTYIHDTATTGVYFKGGATNCVIERTKIENCGGAGILVGFDTSPEFFDLEVNPDYYESIHGIVRNCFISETNLAGIGLYASRYAKIYNNTIVNTAKMYHSPIYFGITFQDWEPEAKRPANLNPTIMNNLIKQSETITTPIISIRYTTDLGGLSALDGPINIDYNCYYKQNGSNIFEDNRPNSILQNGSLDDWKTHINGDAHSIESNPNIDSTFHLQSGSPCIDIGTQTDYVTYDIDQEERINAFDIGADESIL